MGSKKVLPVYPLIINGAMTGTATITSTPTNIQNLDNVGIQVSWTGTPTGTISVLCSVDGVQYDSLTFTPTLAQPAGSAGSYLINLNQLPFPMVEVQYTNTSGTGVFNASIFGKDLN